MTSNFKCKLKLITWLCHFSIVRKSKAYFRTIWHTMDRIIKMEVCVCVSWAKNNGPSIGMQSRWEPHQFRETLMVWKLLLFDHKCQSCFESGEKTCFRNSMPEHFSHFCSLKMAERSFSTRKYSMEEKNPSQTSTLFKVLDFILFANGINVSIFVYTYFVIECRSGERWERERDCLSKTKNGTPLALCLLWNRNLMRIYTNSCESPK